MALRGITWDHPRGYRALDAIAAGTGDIVWSRQALAGFEETPLDELAEEFDLLVIDHPNLGAAGATTRLLPLDDASLGIAPLLAELSAQSVGRSFDSYRADGGLWALPLDAATQVTVRTPGSASPPDDWAGVVEHARAVPTALCLGGPHAFLMLAALCAGEGRPLVDADGDLDLDVIDERLELMARLLDLADEQASTLTPIRLLDLMASGRGPQYCPLVYGYVSYQDGPRPVLRVGDAPLGTVSRGSVLGGTGLAISSRTPDRDAAVAAAARLLSPSGQRATYPREGGQSARLDVWTDPAQNALVNGFYADTLATMRDAWVRPRAAWYPALQRIGSDLVREGLIERRPARRIRQELERRHDEARETA